MILYRTAPLGPELTRKVLKVFPELKIMQGYGELIFLTFRDFATRLRAELHLLLLSFSSPGLTETSPTVTITAVDVPEGAYGSIGVILPNVQARLMDDDEKDVPTGKEERGELWVRGTNVM